MKWTNMVVIIVSLIFSGFFLWNLRGCYVDSLKITYDHQERVIKSTLQEATK